TLSDAASHSGTSLRDAIINASSGETIIFQSTLSGAINLSTSGGGQGKLTISKSLTIAEPYGKSIIVEGGASAGNSLNSQVFSITTGTVAFNSLTIRNGFTTAGGAAIYNKGNLTLNGCTLSGNSAGNASGNAGGAIFNLTGAVTIAGSTL